MKKIFFALIVLFGSQSLAEVCIGNMKIDNIGQISHEIATLKFESQNRATYTGPHASLDLGKAVDLVFKKADGDWFLDDLSNPSTHGGEINRFWYRRISEQSLQFHYNGSYGYTVAGTMNCR